MHSIRIYLGLGTGFSISNSSNSWSSNFQEFVYPNHNSIEMQRGNFMIFRSDGRCRLSSHGLGILKVWFVLVFEFSRPYTSWFLCQEECSLPGTCLCCQFYNRTQVPFIVNLSREINFQVFCRTRYGPADSSAPKEITTEMKAIHNHNFLWYRES